MNKTFEKKRKTGRPAKNLIADSPFSIALSGILRGRNEPNSIIEARGKLSGGTLKNVLRSGNPTLATVWAIEDALSLPRGALCTPAAPPASQTEMQEGAPEAEAANAPTPILALPPGNAVRRKGDEDAAHRVLRLKTVGDAAALEKGSGLRGIFDDGAPFWDAAEIPETTHLVRVRGDSMSPMLMHGQYAMVGPQYLVERGDVPGHREIVIAEVTVQENDIGGEDGQWEGVHCKRIQDGGDFWHFTSINPTGASFSVAKDNCRLWRVIGVYFAGKGKPPEDD